MPDLPHGGRLQQAARQHPDAPRPWIDLSTGINPNAYPFTPPPPEAWRRLPEPEDLAALEAAAAQAYGAPDPACVVAAPGTQALIQLLPRLLPQSAITVPAHTYAEHAATWSAAGTSVTTAPTRAAVLCNPNNPDGARRPAAELLAQDLDLLVVDEAFADFEPGLSLVPHLRPGLVVLRSFGKAFGLAGLRLGFALSDPATTTRIRAALGPWAVSGPAIAIGREALADTAWRDAASARAHADAARLDLLLSAPPRSVLGGTALFRLVETANAAALAHHLARAGILVRSFDHSPTRLRFGLPPDEPAWQRLTAALQSFDPARATAIP